MFGNVLEFKLLDKESNLDHVTKLNLMPFFISQYNNYITKYPNSNLIFIDFAKLKRINDQFTHKGGNACLESFGKILNTVFSDSLTARKHGDEFLILTHYSYDEIKVLFDKCKQIIQNHFSLDFIPVIYDFNSGVVPAEHGIDSTINKADIMMYEAKKNGLTYLDFDQEVYEKIKADEKFISNTSLAINNDELTLAKHQIYKLDKSPTHIFDIYTRDAEGKSLFTENKLQLLRDTNELRKLDYLNLKRIILSSSIPYGDKIIINLDGLSLFSKDIPFPRFMNALVATMTGNPSNYIICVNIKDFSDNSKELIEYLKIINDFGFELALSSFDLTDYNPLLNIWEKTPVKFIKISQDIWKSARENQKTNSKLYYNIQSFLANDIAPIFMKVENEEDLDFISKISTKSLIEGNIIKPEENFQLKI